MNHQRLICYQLAMSMAKAMPELLSQIPRGEGYLTDQLKRALASSILNLSEGNGRYPTKERNRFFDFSLGSISETMGAIETASAYAFIDSEFAEKLLYNLNKAYYMIRKLKR